MFEAVKASDNGAPKELKFDEFKLSQSRERKSLPLNTELQALRKAQTYTFRAKKMPDFSETYKGVKPPSPKKLTSFEPFNLTTLNRGDEKQSKFQEAVKIEQAKNVQDACFKATPVRSTNKNVVTLSDRVKSDKLVTRAVGMSLTSQERSVKRGLFE